jgi:hypothetical protein
MQNSIGKKVLILGSIVLFIDRYIIPNIVGEKQQLDKSLVYDELLPTETLSHDELDQENSDGNGSGISSGYSCMDQSFTPTLNMLTRVELIVFNVGDL